jgi:hypothetical protein
MKKEDVHMYLFSQYFEIAYNSESTNMNVFKENGSNLVVVWQTSVAHLMLMLCLVPLCPVQNYIISYLATESYGSFRYTENNNHYFQQQQRSEGKIKQNHALKIH